MSEPKTTGKTTAKKASRGAATQTESSRALFLRDLLRYLGPGFVVTIGFIDPGNWATNIAGGSKFGYGLLWVISLSTLMLIALQHAAARLGIVTGRSLAANVRRQFPRPLVWLFGVTIVLACAATELAEYLGASLGFSLLLHIPVWAGAPLTLAVVLVLILGQQYDNLERVIVGFLALIGICYVIELFLVHPMWNEAAVHWVVPHLGGGSILVAVGILGAIVMPHNLYLHSNVILSREWDVPEGDRRRLMQYELIDTTLAMSLGWLINSAMIIVAAAVFFDKGIAVDTISQASETLRPLVGPLSQFLFGLALLAAGLSSSVTSSLATANVVTGYLGKPEDPHSALYRWSMIGISVPAMIIIAIGLNPYLVLILSQVALSIQLPLTIIPLLILVHRRSVMGPYGANIVEHLLGWSIALIVIGLNVFLLLQIAGVVGR